VVSELFSVKAKKKHFIDWNFPTLETFCIANGKLHFLDSPVWKSYLQYSIKTGHVLFSIVLWKNVLPKAFKNKSHGRATADAVGLALLQTTQQMQKAIRIIES